MNLEKYKAINNLTTNDIVEMLYPEFPRFRKNHVSMVSKGTYGVTLAPQAVRILNKAHPPKKEKRVRGNRITVWMNDYLYAMLLSRCDETGLTRQDVAEMAIYTYLRSEARRSEPHKLNSKLRNQLKERTEL